MDLCPVCGHSTAHLKDTVLFHKETGTLVYGGGSARLSASESKAFAVLWAAFPELVVLERMHIAIYPSPDDEPAYAESTVKVFIHNLRRRIAPLGMAIENIFGTGYRLRFPSLPQE